MAEAAPSWAQDEKTPDWAKGAVSPPTPAKPSFLDTQLNVARSMGQAGIGLGEEAISSVLGAPADIANLLGSFPGKSGIHFRGGSGDIKSLLNDVVGEPKSPQDEKDRAAGGEALMALGGGRSALKAPPPMVGNTVVTSVLPGALARGERTIEAMAKPTGKYDTLGQAILDVVGSQKGGNQYAKLFEERAKRLAEAAHVEESQRGRAFSQVYNDPQFAPLKKFEDSPLGKKLTNKTGEFSQTVKADPADVPHKVFDTPDGIRQFRHALGGDQKKVELFTKQYAAEQLSNIVKTTTKPEEANFLKTSQAGAITTKLRNWRLSKEQEWLNEVPETKKAVDDIIQGFEDVAVAQKRFKLGVTALTGLASLGTTGYGLSRFIPFKSLYGGAE